MGLHFSLKNANAVGHLIEGNVLTFLDECKRSETTLQQHYEFIKHLVKDTREDFYISNLFWMDIEPVIYELREKWHSVDDIFRNLLSPAYIEKEYPTLLLEFLSSLSNILLRCRIKSILLPGFKETPFDQKLRNRDLLNNLVNIHPGDSVLILQINEKISPDDTYILNAFSKFEKAYNNLEKWPGVLLWTDEESIFIDVKSENEIISIYQILLYEKNAIKYLQGIFENKHNKNHYAYFFHLSDLHFGYSESDKRKLRLIKILESHLASLSDATFAVPLITGDLMDSPSELNMNSYIDFKEHLKAKGFDEPIQLLGNHDIDVGGIRKRLAGQKAIISSLAGHSQIKIFEDLKLGFILFNSNTDGEFAQGKIGNNQLMQIGNELDSIPNKEKFTFIALLHHHPKVIDNPEWYALDWFETILGAVNLERSMKLLDADVFLEWIENRGIQLVLHGHKHIPKIHSHKQITIVAAGSATGKVKHKEAGKTFISYNVIKYNITNKKPVSCCVIVEEVIGSGTKSMMFQLL